MRGREEIGTSEGHRWEHGKENRGHSLLEEGPGVMIASPTFAIDGRVWWRDWGLARSRRRRARSSEVERVRGTSLSDMGQWQCCGYGRGLNKC